MSTIIKLFSGKEYTSPYDWESTNINAEDGNSFVGGNAFIEVFYEHHYVRGDGKTFKEAEKNAWEKQQKIINCKGHEYKRLSDSGNGVCIHCNQKISSLENIKTCEYCENPSFFFYEYNKVCSKHFIEKVENEIVNKKINIREDRKVRLLISQYNTLKYVLKNEPSLNEKELYEKLRTYNESYSVIMDLIEKINPKIELDDLFYLADLIETNYQYNILLLNYMDDEENINRLNLLIKELL